MIRIATPTADWPAMFEAEAARLAAALGPQAQRIDHVGSTAVPGLAAKSVIDIQVSVPALQPRAPLVAALASLGYEHVDLGDFDHVYPFFQRPGPTSGHAGPGTHHVHLCVAGSPQEHDHLAFRDALRSDPARAQAYEALKRHLATRHHGATLASREAYSLAKSDFVRAVLAGRRLAAVGGSPRVEAACGPAMRAFPDNPEVLGVPAATTLSRPGPPSWRFRPTTAADAEPLAALRVEAMRPSLEPLGRFDPARARERFLARFEPRWTRWIELSDDRAGGRPGEPVGLVVLRPDVEGPAAEAGPCTRAARWWLDHFYLRPAWQGAGLGSAVLQVLLEETDRSGQAVRVGALRGSPANGFYRRHGFQGLEETEWDLYYLRPARASARADDPAVRSEGAASGAAAAPASPVPDDPHHP